MSDIFLSYASKDRERVRPLVEALTHEGWSVFWDRDIPVGKTWDQVLEEELGNTRSLLVVWSKNSIDSRWVKAEASEASRLKLPLFPVLLDGVSPPLGFRHTQAADFTAWDRSPTSPEFQRLARAIKSELGVTPGPEVPKPEPIQPEPRKPEPPEPKPIEPRKPKIWEVIRKNQEKFIGVAATLALILILVGVWYYLKDRGFTNSIGMEFRNIPAGTFQMGCPPDEPGRDGDEPRHQVTLSRPFYLQTTEVTQGQWEKVMGDNPAGFPKCGADCPVENVSWNDAQKFIAKLNHMEETDAYRLPTEAEWEYACRAGSESRFYFGDDEARLEDYAWYRKNSGGKTHPVRKLNPNAWGLYDMLGNVYEWVHDWYGDYTAGPVTDPKGPRASEDRVLRGGSWANDASEARSANRYQSKPGDRSDTFGFRVARDP